MSRLQSPFFGVRAYRNQARNSCQAYQLVLESCVYYEAPYLDLNRLSSPRTRNECLPTCPTFHPISLQMIGMSDSKVEESLFSSAADFTFLPYDEMGLIHCSTFHSLPDRKYKGRITDNPPLPIPRVQDPLG